MIDGVRVLTPTRHEFLQRVPGPLESLGRIGADCPAAWLLSAQRALEAGSGRAVDYLLALRQPNRMLEAAKQCLDAACHAAGNEPVGCQLALLHAVRIARGFLAAAAADAVANETNGSAGSELQQCLGQL
ncbi:unnamed protein product [Protopolystoma xenopodis]|uniref:Vps16 N-terminal domain-containing protein n=1 Tax=Protopolystoma xenopodis TaxID=117903 RepID=A0A3S5BJT6_9PLAT|nr:unnamed protein product [Protopolystoma xenopodis]